MEFVIEVNGITLTISAPFELDLTFLQNFLDTLTPMFEFEFEDDEDDGVEFDDEGTAWWYDEVDDSWHYFDEESEEWELYEDEE
jgi:hypothetical protein